MCRKLLVSIGLLFLLCGVSSAQETFPEIVFSNDAPTTAEFRKQELKFFLNELTLYEKHTGDSDEIKAIALPFLRDAITADCRQLIYEVPGIVDDATLLAVGKKVLDAGSNDPLVLRCYSETLRSNEQEEESQLFANRALSEFKVSKYPAGLKLIFLNQVQRTHKFSDEDKAKDRLKEALRMQADWFDYASIVPNNQRVAFDRFWKITNFHRNSYAHRNTFSVSLFSHDFYHGFEEYKKKDNADPWIVAMVEGTFCYKEGWLARGGGYAHTVTKEGGKTFSKKCKRAVRLFKKAYKFDPSRPEAAAAMIPLAHLGHDTDSKWVWFQRCIDAELDQPDAYSSMQQYMHPKWGGSIEEMLNFGTQCARSGRYDTLIPLAYPSTLNTIVGEKLMPLDELYKSPKTYQRVKFVVNRIADHPVHRSNTGDLSNYQVSYLGYLFLVAYKTGRNADALDLLDRLKGLKEFDRTVHLETVGPKLHAQLKHGKQLEEALPFAQLNSSPQDLSKALKIYQSLLAECDDDSRPHIESLLTDVELQIEYLKGGWVDLKFDPALTQWLPYINQGNLKFESESTVSGSNLTGGSRITAYVTAKLPGPKEIQVEVAKNKHNGKSDLEHGIFAGSLTYPGDGLLFWISFNQRRAGIAKVPELEKSHPYIRLAEQTYHHLHVKAFPESTEFFVDGRYIGIADTDAAVAPLESFGFGNIFWQSKTGKVRYKNFRVRKIDYRAQEGDLDFEYFSDAIQRDPDKDYYYYGRGRCQLVKGNFEDAFNDLETARIRGEVLSLPPLAICSNQTGRFEYAKQICERGIKRMPSEVDASHLESLQASLAFTLAMAPMDEIRDGQRAYDLAEKVIKSSRGKRGYDVLAYANAELGLFDHAAEAFRKFKKLTPPATKQESKLRAKRLKLMTRRQPVRSDVDRHKDDGPVVDWIAADPTQPARTLDGFSDLTRQSRFRCGFDWNKYNNPQRFLDSPGDEYNFTVHSPDNALHPHVVIDLGEVKNIRLVEIINRVEYGKRNRAKGLTIWTSNDDQTWDQAWVGTHTWDKWLAKLPEKTEARYVKIGLPERGILNLKGATVFGKMSSGESE